MPNPSLRLSSECSVIERSSRSQILLCLVTVEVPKQERVDAGSYQSAAADNVSTQSRQQIAFDQHQPTTDPREPPEALEQVADDLRLRVSNWYGVDTQKSVYSRNNLFLSQAESIPGSEASSFMASTSSPKIVHTGRSCSATCSIMSLYV